MAYISPRVTVSGTIATVDSFHRRNAVEGGPEIPCVRVGLDGLDGCRLRVEVYDAHPSQVPGLGASVEWVAEIRARESSKTFSDGRRYSPLIDFLFLRLAALDNVEGLSVVSSS